MELARGSRLSIPRYQLRTLPIVVMRWQEFLTFRYYAGLECFYDAGEQGHVPLQELSRNVESPADV